MTLKAASKSGIKSRSLDLCTQDLRIQNSSVDKTCWLEGYIGTPNGFVKVISRGLDYRGIIPSQTVPDWTQNTTLEIILGGKVYATSHAEGYLHRRLVTVAAEFAEKAAKEAREE